ncbi:MAG TPA: hypothetical protein VI685_21220 [Candidatus Angelobacter sp.]
MEDPNRLPEDILNLPLNVRAEMALREAVREALVENVRLGLPAYIWRDGQLVAVPPEEIREFLAKPEPPLSSLQNGVNGTSKSDSKPE